MGIHQARRGKGEGPNGLELSWAQACVKACVMLKGQVFRPLNTAREYDKKTQQERPAGRTTDE